MCYIQALCWFLVLTLFNVYSNTSENSLDKDFKAISADIYSQAANLLLSGRSDDIDIIKSLEYSLQYDPLYYQSNQLIGALYLRVNNDSAAIHHLEIACEISNYQKLADVSNLLEACRRMKAYEKGKRIGDAAYASFPNSIEYLKNYALLLQDMHEYDDAVKIFRHIIELEPLDKKAWEALIRIYADYIDVIEAEKLCLQAMKLFPDDIRVLFQYAAVQHLQQRVEIALDIYMQVYNADPTFIPVISNIGATQQSLGHTEEALHWYSLAYELLPTDAGILNNLGSLYGIMSRKDMELGHLLQAITLDPDLQPALVNLGGYYQDEGMNEESKLYISRAFHLASSSSKASLALRVGGMLSPIAMSWEQMIDERLTVERNLLLMINMTSNMSPEVAEKLKVTLDGTSDRIHFYIVYHCYNDRYMQELYAKAYHAIIRDIDYISSTLSLSPPYPLQSSISSDNHVTKVRIAFISKFFGIFEPHGQLLDGIMKYLPRDIFTVICFPVVRTDGKPLSPDVYDAVDEIYEISLLHRHAVDQIIKHDIDILVFADVLSEPINHYLAYHRLAKIQIAFWGNPVTSASYHMDYFVSGYHLEHPYRTRMMIADEPYTEQVVLLSGQGIWYKHPIPPEVDILRVNLSIADRKMNATREEFGFQDDWFIFLCPQSTFKIHPLFDKVFAEILYKTSPNSHLVVTGGRRPLWTEMYSNRIRAAMTAYVHQHHNSHNDHEVDLISRFHILDRVSSERFIAIVKLADVVLHPFPFDGSRTSADALIAGIPYITLPTEYLRGRMGLAFYRTMNLPDLVAKNKSSYINVAVTLYNNASFLHDLKMKIKDRVSLIWEDMFEPYEWSDFLIRVAASHIINDDQHHHITPLSWEEFISISGRDVLYETMMRDRRIANRISFDTSWGDETYMLSTYTGEAILDSFPSLSYLGSSYHMPRVFDDWRDDKSSINRTRAYHSHQHRLAMMDKWWLEHTKTHDHVSHHQHQDDDVSAVSVFEEMIHELSSSSYHEIQTMNNHDVDDAMTLNHDDIIDAIRNFHDMIRAGNIIQAKTVASSLYDTIIISMNSSSYHHDHHLFDESIIFIIEYGLMHFYLGDYQPALHHCQHAQYIIMASSSSSNSNVSSLTAQVCIAIAAMHLHIEDTCIDALYRAWMIYHHIQANDLHSSGMMIPGRYDSMIYRVNPSTIHYNMISGLKTFHRYDECVAMIVDIIDDDIFTTSSSLERLSYVLFSFIDWSYDSRDALNRAQHHLIDHQILSSSYHHNMSMFDMIIMIRSKIFYIIDSSLDCIIKVVDPSHADAINIISSTILDIIYDATGIHPITIPSSSSPSSTTTSSSSSSSSSHHDDNRSKIVLITQYFISSNPSIQADVNEVLSRNLQHDMIDHVVLLNEMIYTYHNLPNPTRFHQYNIGRRLTFADAFRCANQHYPHHIIILANADIFFDDSLSRLYDHLEYDRIYQYFDHKAMALLKWKDDGHHISLHLRTDSQDAWIMRTPIDDHIITLAEDIVLGSVRCDNRIAKIFSEAGYDIINPAFAIHAIELETRIRVGGLYDMKDAVVGDIMHLLISDIMTFR